MTTYLSEQQRAALTAVGGKAVEVVDEQSRQVYYLIASTEFERLRSMLADETFVPGEMYPLIAKTAGSAGWNDPVMDEYNHLDESRNEG